MKNIAIVTAMESEANYIIEKYNLKLTHKKTWISIFEWEYKNHKIILALCGIWKIFATIWTTYLFENYIFDKLVNIWLAGGISKDKKINIWDVFLPNIFHQHDFYIPFDWSEAEKLHNEIILKQIIKFEDDNFNIFNNWTCLTWDQFIDSPEKVSHFQEKYNWDLVEMEAYSIASVAREYHALDKLIMIKWICDNGTESADTDLKTNLDLAMKNSLLVLEKVFS